MKLDIDNSNINDKVIKNTLQIKEINEKMLKLTATTEQIAKILVKQKAKISEIELKQDNLKLNNLDNFDNMIDAVLNEIKSKQNEEKIEAIDIEFISQKVAEKLNLNNNVEKKKVKKVKADDEYYEEEESKLKKYTVYTLSFTAMFSAIAFVLYYILTMKH